MQLVGLLVINVVHREPDSVQIDGCDEIAQQRSNLDYLRRIGRHLGQFHAGFKLRRRTQVERQRDVLGNVLFRARHAMLGDEEADLVALGASVFALGQSLVHLVADASAAPARCSSRPSS